MQLTHYLIIIDQWPPSDRSPLSSPFTPLAQLIGFHCDISPPHQINTYIVCPWTRTAPQNSSYNMYETKIIIAVQVFAALVWFVSTKFKFYLYTVCCPHWTRDPRMWFKLQYLFIHVWVSYNTCELHVETPHNANDMATTTTNRGSDENKQYWLE